MPHRHGLDEPVALAVLGHQGNAAPDALAHGRLLQVHAQELDGSGRCGEATGDRLQEFGATRRHQAVDADDLAGVDVEVEGVDGEALGVARVGDL